MEVYFFLIRSPNDNTLADSILELLWTALLWKCWYRFLFDMMCSGILGINHEWDCCITSYFIPVFKNSACCFSQWLHSFGLLPALQERLPLAVSWPACVTSCLLDDTRADRGEVTSHCVRFALLWWPVMLSIFFFFFHIFVGLLYFFYELAIGGTLLIS